MSTNPIRIAVILGSIREGRFGPVVANWFTEQAKLHGDLEIDLIDLADIDLPMVLPAYGGTPSSEAAAALATVSPRLAAADAFVVVTPEFNHSYPAPLKNLIDWHQTEWHAKPVGFVAYGGMSSGLRAVEHLRNVFAELHAVTIRETVSFQGAWAQFEEDGSPKDPEGVNTAAKALLDQLGWWALGLREARAKRPYAA
ncbi:NAD(P)H-dependent oxidoreductase [Streptomyces sp. A3M-1-3]|uniref:NADPH-dependent FMN reductase n=1 Tax=Streptomyces sp. A3M-1-3 TaxID=2962044 RepID=UPI0020B67B74|nr:NAD(P)H-dependent oxidoreductase [Streptomyces sp. A3M-1-3]MCP3822254.1 NAD(P)H-dependent oxidoreductase [Streptomyces sp. A3M-1-3]